MKIGIHQSYWGRVGGGQRYVAVVAELLAREHDVEIIHPCQEFDPRSVEEPMQVDLRSVKFRSLPSIERPNWTTRHPLRRLKLERNLGKEVSEPYDLFIDSSDVPPLFNHAPMGVLLTHFPLVSFDDYHGRTSATWRTRSRTKRLVTGLYQGLEWNRRFATYDLCIVNSEYTKQWTKRRWGVDAVVAYPPLRSGLRLREKDRTILSIGAFRAVQHKKQTAAIDTFKSLCDDGLAEWRYVMLGALGPDPHDGQYLAELRNRAAGYPIEIAPDVSGDVLKSHLEKSSLLWHSMGYGIDERREPERMEHFGMVATEAMAAGCVPLLFRGGGLTEIVDDGRTGFLWSTQRELTGRTRLLVNNNSLRKTLSEAAVTASMRFESKAFERRFLSSLEVVLRTPSTRQQDGRQRE